MMKIGIISDTHGYVHPRIPEFFSGVDEIWHAGDIGSLAVADQLSKLKPFRAVHGNIDGGEIRHEYPGILSFRAEDVKVLMTHIGEFRGRYDAMVRQLIGEEKPLLFVCGHSHILKVKYDEKLGLLHVNPGAAGKSGIHKSITAIRMVIEGNNMRDLEVLDIPR